ncbi:hypothetical protein A0128_20380 [Leptospira tipperaryensis]|uniref:DUF4145 domain-containing protein n=1 Tax=Leptospira tipperaryensis TaxID=2564040 RepID=A0A1D7V489_9LEPT|nr:hypothetical protein A0128_20380 [Leptospira tipperaryensis]
MKSETLIYPRSSSRTSISAELIPEQIFKDYTESANVLSISPKASAALSRRCLQNLIQNYAGIKGKSLDDEITQLISTGKLPTYITASIDAIRNIGNFAAHPKKSQQSGEIVEVETGEAEWTLDVLESLFDFYFIQPSIINEKKDALNKKLNDLGKPKMK